MKEVYDKNKDPDWARIAHLFKIGIFASLLALIGGDMVLGWGTADMSLDSRNGAIFFTIFKSV